MPEPPVPSLVDSWCHGPESRDWVSTPRDWHASLTTATRTGPLAALGEHLWRAIIKRPPKMRRRLAGGPAASASRRYGQGVRRSHAETRLPRTKRNRRRLMSTRTEQCGPPISCTHLPSLDGEGGTRLRSGGGVRWTCGDCGTECAPTHRTLARWAAYIVVAIRCVPHDYEWGGSRRSLRGCRGSGVAWASGR